MKLQDSKQRKMNYYSNKDKQNKKNFNHKFTPECLLKCIKWKIDISLTSNKFSTGFVKN